MSTLVKEIYEALMDVGANKEIANRVADSLSQTIDRFVVKDDDHIARKSDIADLKQTITDMDRKMAESKASMIMWMAGFHVASVGIIVTLLLNT